MQTNILSINSWLQHCRYILRRNRGYAYRKVLNLMLELSEVACYAWLLSTTAMRDYLLVPIFMILFSFVFDQLILFARSEGSKARRFIQKVIIPVFVVILLLNSLAILMISHEMTTLILIIFTIKVGAIFIQLLISSLTIEYYALRRIRPQMTLYFLIAIVVSGACLYFSIRFSGVDVILMVTTAFVVTKIFYEFLYFKAVKKVKQQRRFVDRISQKQVKLVSHETSLYIILLLLLIKVLAIPSASFNAYLITLFIAVTSYRIQSRIYRFLWVDFLTVKNNLIRKYFLKRTNLILLVVNMVLTLLFWNMSHYLGVILIGTIAAFQELMLIRYGKIFKTCIFVDLLLIIVLNLNHDSSFVISLTFFLSVTFQRFWMHKHAIKSWGIIKNIDFLGLAASLDRAQSFDFRLYGNKVCLDQITKYCEENQLKLRQISRRVFRVYFSQSRGPDLKFISLFGEFILLVTLKEENLSSRNVLNKKLGKGPIFLSYWGFWSGYELTTIDTLKLNVKADRVREGISPSLIKTKIMLSSGEYCVGSLRGDQWYLKV